MIECQVEQGSPEWLALRLGVPTASEFHKIVTPTGKLSAQSRGYACRLVAEKVLNRSLDSLQGLEWVERGKEFEPEAARMYAFQTEAETRACGFILTDDRRLGASPDLLLVGQPGGVEIKCCSPAVHVDYMLHGFGADYIPQVQGQMLVAELEFVDRFAFHPEMPPVLVRTPRDEAYIAKLRDALAAFLESLDEMLAEVQARGAFAERARLLTPAEAHFTGSAIGFG